MVDDTHLSRNDLRSVISRIISENIELHRRSRAGTNPDYWAPSGEPTDEEVDDFILSNPLYETETASQLTDPGGLGFGYPSAVVSAEAMREFEQQTQDWAKTNEWLAADLVPYHLYAQFEPDNSEVWLPSSILEPRWFQNSPNALLLAADLLREGRTLSDLHWREFEELIGQMLEREGWVVELTRGSKDGGIDLIARKQDVHIGQLRSIWQAKKYSLSNKVRLAEVRELSGLVSRPDVTKGIIVTTSHLTRGAIEWIRKDTYRLDYKDKDAMETWVRSHLGFGNSK